jgi:hypothetical protein
MTNTVSAPRSSQPVSIWLNIWNGPRRIDAGHFQRDCLKRGGSRLRSSLQLLNESWGTRRHSESRADKRNVESRPMNLRALCGPPPSPMVHGQKGRCHISAACGPTKTSWSNSKGFLSARLHQELGTSLPRLLAFSHQLRGSRGAQLP